MATYLEYSRVVLIQRGRFRSISKLRDFRVKPEIRILFMIQFNVDPTQMAGGGLSGPITPFFIYFSNLLYSVSNSKCCITNTNTNFVTLFSNASTIILLIQIFFKLIILLMGHKRPPPSLDD